MNANTSPDAPPIACDMTGATDTMEERVADYRRIFDDALIGRERTDHGIRFRFRAGPGVEERVRNIAAREKACCSFFTFEVVRHDDEIWWDASVVDDDIARQILDEFYRLPDTVSNGVESLHQRFSDQGLEIVINDDGVYRPATRHDLGLAP